MSWTAPQGGPSRTAVATWTMAESTMVADALATALFFVPGAVLEQPFRFFLADGIFGRQCRILGRI